MSIDSMSGLLPANTATRNPYAPSDAERIKHNASPSKSSLRRSLSRRLSRSPSRNATRNAEAPADYYAEIKAQPTKAPITPQPTYRPSSPSQSNHQRTMTPDPIPARPLSRGANLRRSLSARFGYGSPSRSQTPTPQVKVELVDVAPAANLPAPSRPAERAEAALSSTSDTSLRPQPKRSFRWSTGALPTVSDLNSIPEDGVAKGVRFQLDDRVQPEAIPGVQRPGVPRTVRPAAGLTRSATTAGTGAGGLGRSGTLRGLFRSKSSADAAATRHRPVRSWSAPVVPKIEDDDDEDEDSGEEEYATYARQEFAFSMGLCDYGEYRWDY